jgi:hypothetical protein
MIGGLLRQGRIEDNKPRAAMGPDLLEFTRAQAGIDRNGPRVELADGEQDRTERDAVLAGDHDPIARPDLQFTQIVGGGLDRVRELPVAPRTSGFDERRVFRRFLRKFRVDVVHARRQVFDQVVRSDAFDTGLHGALLDN